ncbi:MAG TPA: GMC family oxidoreductase N-terminal domain-containing protein, partial [bacterium]|nr:GMC family oxidoreductase N-terminal domain-containing protein [bacterium]
TKADFHGQEGWSYPNLYQDRGGRATEDLSISILQGRGVGGSTVVNWTTCFRTPKRVLEHWKTRWGVEGLDYDTLVPSWEKVEARLGVQEIPIDLANKNNRSLWDGATKLGWKPEALRRNVRDCRQSGQCGMGCPFDAKQAMHITYVPDALHAGAKIFANAKVERLEREGNRITAVHAIVLDPETEKPTGRTITVKAPKVILCGGAINSPRLLLRSGITEGNVGRRTWLHPVVGVAGVFPHRVEGFYGAPQSVSCHQFAEREEMGFFLELAPVQPMLISISARGSGEEHRRAMEKMPFTVAMISLAIDGFHDDEPGGTIGLRPSGAPKIEYALTPRFWNTARAGIKAMTQVLLAAGADEVRSLHNEAVIMKSEADLPKLDDAPYAPNRLGVYTAHQMNGYQMGKDPATSVVRSDMRHHAVENLWIVDGSVFPTSLGVNPSLSIYGLATHAAKGIADAKA